MKTLDRSIDGVEAGTTQNLQSSLSSVVDYDTTGRELAGMVGQRAVVAVQLEDAVHRHEELSTTADDAATTRVLRLLELRMLIRLTICFLLCLYRSKCIAVDPEALLDEVRVVRELALE